MCTEATLNEITSRVVQAARDSLGDKLHKVILYGSYARGDYDDESDIDIMVLADMTREEAQEADKKISNLLRGIDLEYSVMVSVMVTSSAMYYAFLNAMGFYRNVQKDGVVLCA